MPRPRYYRNPAGEWVVFPADEVAPAPPARPKENTQGLECQCGFCEQRGGHDTDVRRIRWSSQQLPTWPQGVAFVAWCGNARRYYGEGPGHPLHPEFKWWEVDEQGRPKYTTDRLPQTMDEVSQALGMPEGTTLHGEVHTFANANEPSCVSSGVPLVPVSAPPVPVVSAVRTRATGRTFDIIFNY